MKRDYQINQCFDHVRITRGRHDLLDGHFRQRAVDFRLSVNPVTIRDRYKLPCLFAKTRIREGALHQFHE